MTLHCSDVITVEDEVQVQAHVEELDEGLPDNFTAPLLSLLDHEFILLIRGVTSIFLQISIQIVDLKVYVPLHLQKLFLLLRRALVAAVCNRALTLLPSGL